MNNRKPKLCRWITPEDYEAASKEPWHVAVVIASRKASFSVKRESHRYLSGMPLYQSRDKAAMQAICDEHNATLTP